MPYILDKIIKSDIVVFASPVYFNSLNAQMKAVIDRTYANIDIIKDKEAYLIITGAAPAKDYMRTTVDSFKGYIQSFDNIKLSGIIYGCGAIEKDSLKEKPIVQEAYNMGIAIK